jgi:hypothetical protein
MSIAAPSIPPSPARAGRAIGAMFFLAFGAAWLCGWAFLALASPWPVAIAIVIACAVLMVIALRVYQANASAKRQADESPDARRRSRLFVYVNIAQWVLVLVVANVLANTGRPGWILPAIMFIVGLHFIPLARIFAYPTHYVTGIALMLLSIGYPLISTMGPGSPAGCLGAGLILWASAAWAVSPYSST